VGGWDLNLCGAIPPCVSIVHRLFKLLLQKDRFFSAVEISCYSSLPSEGDPESECLFKYEIFACTRGKRRTCRF